MIKKSICFYFQLARFQCKSEKGTPARTLNLGSRLPPPFCPVFTSLSQCPCANRIHTPVSSLSLQGAVSLEPEAQALLLHSYVKRSVKLRGSQLIFCSCTFFATMFSFTMIVDEAVLLQYVTVIYIYTHTFLLFKNLYLVYSLYCFLFSCFFLFLCSNISEILTTQNVHEPR